MAPKEAYLDFSCGAARLHNKVRGFAGWPGTKARFVVRRDGEDAAGRQLELKIITTRVGVDEPPPSGGGGGGAGGAGPGAGAVELRKDCLRVPCAGGGWLEVTELQPPGKKAMRAGDFANGLKGSTLHVA